MWTKKLLAAPLVWAQDSPSVRISVTMMLLVEVTLNLWQKRSPKKPMPVWEKMLTQEVQSACILTQPEVTWVFSLSSGVLHKVTTNSCFCKPWNCPLAISYGVFNFYRKRGETYSYHHLIYALFIEEQGTLWLEIELVTMFHSWITCPSQKLQNQTELWEWMKL